MVLEQYRLMKSVPNLTYDVNFLVTNESGMFLNSIGTFYINKLNALKNFFLDETKIFNLKQDQFIEDMLIDYNKNKKTIAKLNFMDLANNEYPWSEVFCKNLYDVSINLSVAFKELDNIIISNIDNTDTLITKAVANRDFIKTTTPLVSNVEETEKVLKKCYDAIDKIIDPNFRKDKVKLKEAIPNFSSLESIINNLILIKEMKFYEKASLLEKTVKSIKEKTDNLEIILKQANPNEVSKPIISMIAMELETSAKVISCLGTLLAATSQAAKTLQTIIREICK